MPRKGYVEPMSYFKGGFKPEKKSKKKTTTTDKKKKTTK